MPQIDIPNLPDGLTPLPTHFAWPAGIIDSFQQLSTAYLSTRRALNLDESDPILLRFYLNHASNNMVSIVKALGMHEGKPLPPEYFQSLAHSISSLILHLREALKQAEIRCVFIQAVITEI
jgi:hypothetical protein